MNFRSSALVAIISAAIVAGIFFKSINDKERESALLSSVLGILEQVHFKPINIDNDLSEKAFDQYIEMLDGNKRFLLQSEVDQLSEYRQLLDDQIKAKSSEFFDLSLGIIDAAVKRAEGIFEMAIDSDFDTSNEEYIELDSDKRSFASSEKELKEYWQNSLNYEIITKLNRKLDDQEDESAEEQKSTAELMRESKEDVDKLFSDWFKRLSKVRREDRFELFVNSFVRLFDPHTSYLSPKDKADFNISMGGKLEGIGARLQPDGDYTKVASIVPGGPAWKGKDLQVDDLIKAVAQGIEGEYLDIYGMRLDDVVQKIRGKKGTVVRLMVKKKDGTEEEVVIERDEVIIDESFARSVILDKEGLIDNVGYIKLPKFYSSFEGKDGNSCALDIAAEIAKLKAEGAKGIILDLRYNGGGSLKDVIDMSGYFIEEGPIVQVKSKNRQPSKYEDQDESVLWDGPLIVMVNSYSASASEILAAALQDYGRAVIVGSTTFGKGTVQRFYDLDRVIRGNNDIKPLGELKLTMQKFYRVNGGSTQLRGVTPDISIPDRFSEIEVGEREYDNAMGWSEIDAVDYGQNVYMVQDLNTLKANSASRIAANPKFEKIIENAQRLKKNNDKSNYPLDLKSFSDMIDEREAESEQFESLFDQDVDGMSIANLAIDMDKINMDSSHVQRNEDWIKQLKKDFYIDETLHIMSDMIGNQP